MKKLLIPATALLIAFYACGPAAEDREAMDRNAHRTSDSIKKWLDSSLNDPIREMGGTMPYGGQPAAAAPANTAAATGTAPAGQK